MLEVASISRLPEARCSNVLGDCGLNARTDSVEALPFLRVHQGAGPSERPVMLLDVQKETPAFCFRTSRFQRTRRTVALGKSDLDVPTPSLVLIFSPGCRGLPCRANGRLGLVINIEVLLGEAGWGAGLPAWVLPRRSDQPDPLLARIRQVFGIDVRGACKGGLRKQVLLAKRAVDRARTPRFVHVGRCRVRMGDHPGSTRVTGLREVNDIPCPSL